MKLLSKKQRIDLELELYRKERQFEIDSDLKKQQFIQEHELEKKKNALEIQLDKGINNIEKNLIVRKTNLFEDHNSLIAEYNKKRTLLLSEIAELEAKKDCFDAEIKSLNKIIESKDLVISTKDSEIKNLNTIISLLIKDYPKIGGSETTINKVK